jgi:hypothetical protein
MCGDLEEEDGEGARLYAGFLQNAHAAIHEAIDHRGGARSRLDSTGDAPAALSDASMHAYMDGLFGDILNACIKDGRRAAEPDRYRVLCSQSVVLARLAGFLAGQLATSEDPLRNSIEALMAGYGEQTLDAAHTHG